MPRQCQILSLPHTPPFLPYPAPLTSCPSWGRLCSASTHSQCYGPTLALFHRSWQCPENPLMGASSPVPTTAADSSLSSQHSYTHTILPCLLLSCPATTHPTGIKPLLKVTHTNMGLWPALERISLNLPSHSSVLLCELLTCLWAAAISLEMKVSQKAARWVVFA